MASPLVKPLAAATLVGASGTGGYFGSKFLSSPSKEVPIEKKSFSVAELLSKDTTKTLLQKSLGKDHDDWKAAWKGYIEKNTNSTTDGSDPLKVEGWAAKKSTTDSVPEEFLNRCDDESKKTVSSTSDAVYVTVSTWCTKAVTAQKL
ncbi:hypothetical protein HF1_12570 [Mycoplasma haemofelis str. Langford 1]|uniref:Uncharacterized protein n=1 Tax=Mycoplasma haemofelis (strain Langford 1) TaxID=941640 RepID=E8ZJE4_MYCHL|nr:hypothetical protein [Mycoplasma haemofelis]CBY93265.1 hypothetical protein HF1_12570 [Mycoplasma haemofelis str. Langford 1]